MEDIAAAEDGQKRRGTRLTVNGLYNIKTKKKKKLYPEEEKAAPTAEFYSFSFVSRDTENIIKQCVIQILHYMLRVVKYTFKYTDIVIKA